MFPALLLQKCAEVGDWGEPRLFALTNICTLVVYFDNMSQNQKFIFILANGKKRIVLELAKFIRDAFNLRSKVT